MYNLVWLYLFICGNFEYGTENMVFKTRFGSDPIYGSFTGS